MEATTRRSSPWSVRSDRSRLRRYRLPASGRTDEEQSRSRLDAVCAQGRPDAELFDYGLERFGHLGRQLEVVKRDAWLVDGDQRQVVAGLRERLERRHLQGPASPARLDHDRLELISEEIVTLPALLLDDRFCRVMKGSVVAMLVTSDQSLHKVASSHRLLSPRSHKKR